MEDGKEAYNTNNCQGGEGGGGGGVDETAVMSSTDG